LEPYEDLIPQGNPEFIKWSFPGNKIIFRGFWGKINQVAIFPDPGITAGVYINGVLFFQPFFNLTARNKYHI